MRHYGKAYWQSTLEVHEFSIFRLFGIGESTARNTNVSVIGEHFCTGCGEAAWKVLYKYTAVWHPADQFISDTSY